MKIESLIINPVIYSIKCKINDKIYIGKTQNHLSRLGMHISELLKGTHHCKLLQKDFNLYGIDNFIFEILYISDTLSDLNRLEREYIFSVEPSKLYNSNLRDNKAKKQFSFICTLEENNISLSKNPLPQIEEYHLKTKYDMERISLKSYMNAPDRVEYKLLKTLVLNHFKSGKFYSAAEIKETMQKFAKECNITMNTSKEVMILGCVIKIKKTTKRENGKVIHVIKIC